MSREKEETRIDELRISESLNKISLRTKKSKTLRKASQLLAMAEHPIVQGKRKLTLKLIASAGTKNIFY